MLLLASMLSVKIICNNKNKHLQLEYLEIEIFKLEHNIKIKQYRMNNYLIWPVKKYYDPLV